MNASARPPATRRRAVSSGAAAAVGPSTTWSHSAWVWLVPALVALALYVRTLGYTFVWDDLDLIVRDAALQGSGWARLLAQDFWQATGGGTGMWRPLVTLSYRVDGALSGWQPWAFHLVNVLAHACAAALVAKLARARGLPAWTALGAGLVYASAPALSESTAWVAGRTDVFASLFTLAALVLAREARAPRSTSAPVAASAPRSARAGGAQGSHVGAQSSHVGAGVLTTLSLVCVALALLAKESALVLPLLIAADAADEQRAGARSPWRAALPSLGVVLVWALVHRALVPAPAHPAAPGAALGMAALVWAPLAWLAPWAPHSPLLELWQAPSMALALLAWAALAGVTGGVIWSVRRRAGWALAPALLIAPLVPVAAASLLESGVRFAERSLTLPAAGLALALATLAALVPARPRALAPALLGGWLALQAVAVWPAIGAWRDEESRIRRIASVRPDDLDALLGMADLLSTQGRDAEAAEWIARAERVSPLDAGPLVARASLAFRSGHADQALAAAEAALARAPGDLAAGVLRVRSLARLGRGPAAVAAGEELVRTHPDAPAAQGALGAARFATGDATGALPPLRTASERLLDDAGLAWDLGRAAIATGDVPLARTAFERAVATSPAFYEAWLGVADTRARLGDRAGAEMALARAAALPGAADGRVEVLRGRIERAH